MSPERLRQITLFMSRHFHWQPSEIDALPVEDLLDYCTTAQHMMENEVK